MTPVELIALAASTSLLAGWRLYLVTFITGLGMKFGWIALPDQLQALGVLANNWVLGVAAIGTFAEFFADKIAWVDSAWDAIHSFIRPLGGALRSSIAPTRPGRLVAFCWAVVRRLSPMPERPARGRWSTPVPNPSPT